MKPKLPAESTEKGSFAKVLIWLETHTRIVALIVTVLIVVIVIVVINHFYSKSRIVRAYRELQDAMEAKRQDRIDIAIDKLKSAKATFGNTPTADKYSYELANLYYEAGRLREAKEEYEWFFKNHPNSPLYDYAKPTYNKLLKDIIWLEKEKPKYLLMPTLGTDPYSPDNLSATADISSPAKLPTTKFDLETDKGNKLSFELFDNNAPNTTAHFVSLINGNVYKGVKLYVSGGEKIMPEVTLVEPNLDYKLPLETTNRPPEKYALVLSQDHTAEFNILLKALDSAAVTYSCVFGRLTSGFDTLLKIQSGEAISQITLTEKRENYPEVQTIKKGSK